MGFTQITMEKTTNSPMRTTKNCRTSAPDPDHQWHPAGDAERRGDLGTRPWDGKTHGKNHGKTMGKAWEKPGIKPMKDMKGPSLEL